jgi:hypothetical protein
VVFVTHTDDYPRALAARGVYRIEPSPGGGWDVWLDPPTDPLEGLATGYRERPTLERATGTAPTSGTCGRRAPICAARCRCARSAWRAA